VRAGDTAEDSEGALPCPEYGDHVTEICNDDPVRDRRRRAAAKP